MLSTIKNMFGVWDKNGGGNSVVHAMENKNSFSSGFIFIFMFKCICARCDCRHMETIICIYDPVKHNLIFFERFSDNHKKLIEDLL